MVKRQHAELGRQVKALVGILKRQVALTGKNPLSEEQAEQSQQQQQQEIMEAPPVSPPEQNPGQTGDLTIILNVSNFIKSIDNFFTWHASTP